jgi:hypothetical protein
MPMTFAVVQQCESEREVAETYAIPPAIDGALNGPLDKPCAIRPAADDGSRKCGRHFMTARAAPAGGIFRSDCLVFSRRSSVKTSTQGSSARRWIAWLRRFTASEDRIAVSAMTYGKSRSLFKPSSAPTARSRF